jgi:hypothetical protein
MPFRFRKSFGLPGLKLNISKTGFSISAGVSGAHVNYDLSGRRKKPTRVAVGLPGSGLSYYEDLGGASSVPPPQPLVGPIGKSFPDSGNEQPKRRRALTLLSLVVLLVLAIAIGAMAHW